MCLVLTVRSSTSAVVNIAIGKIAALQSVQDLFRCVTQIDAQMIDQLQRSVCIKPSIKGKFGEGGPTLNEHSARIVADPTNNGRPYAG